jgi:hypothetical protein
MYDKYVCFKKTTALREKTDDGLTCLGQAAASLPLPDMNPLQLHTGTSACWVVFLPQKTDVGLTCLGQSAA